MRNHLIGLLLLVGLISMGCGEPAPDVTKRNGTETPQTGTTTNFHPKAAALFESYTALEKEELDFSAFENEANARSFYTELEGNIDIVLNAVKKQLEDRTQYLTKMKTVDTGLAFFSVYPYFNPPRYKKFIIRRRPHIICDNSFIN